MKNEELKRLKVEANELKLRCEKLGIEMHCVIRDPKASDFYLTCTECDPFMSKILNHLSQGGDL